MIAAKTIQPILFIRRADSGSESSWVSAMIPKTIGTMPPHITPTTIRMIALVWIELRSGAGGGARCPVGGKLIGRSEEHTSELQSRGQLVCRLLLEKKK